MENNQERTKSVKVLERAFRVLEAIAANQGEASLVTICRALSIPHSTIHRLLASLIKLGYVEQNQTNGHYRLGLKILSLSSVVLQMMDLRRIAYDFLYDLMHESGETANLVVLDGDEVVYIEKVESQAAVRYFSLIGRRAPVHATGVGKVLLSEMAQMDIIAILRNKGMPRLTERTITEIEPFLDELALVRKQGFAYDNEECEVGARCIAAPVRNHTGRVVAAMSISGPTARLTPERMKELTPVVMKYATKLSFALGYTKDVMQLKTPLARG